MDSILNALMHVKEFFVSHGAAISSVGGFIMVVVAKWIPNGEAGIVVSKIQWIVDMVAKLAFALGDALHAISDLIGNILKSDGLFGKK